ncbi:MAG: DUF3054 domain-containing protein [Acidimicrobiia bacterium]
MTGRRRTAAPVIDLVCLALFVLIGRGRHEISDSVGWFLGVLWPLALGWFAAALVTKLYTKPSRPWLRLTGTWALGMTLALVARGLVLGRQPVSTFALVLFAFVGLETLGWRAIALLVRRVVPAGA